MSHDPFEELEEKMRKMMKRGVSGGGHSISVRRVSGETTVDVSGDVSDEEIEELKRKYPDAEIRVDGKSIEEEERPVVEVIDEEESD